MRASQEALNLHSWSGILGSTFFKLQWSYRSHHSPPLPLWSKYGIRSPCRASDVPAQPKSPEPPKPSPPRPSQAGPWWGLGGGLGPGLGFCEAWARPGRALRPWLGWLVDLYPSVNSHAHDVQRHGRGSEAGANKLEGARMN
jgi:hypothetical protein